MEAVSLLLVLTVSLRGQLALSKISNQGLLLMSSGFTLIVFYTDILTYSFANL